MVDSPNQSEPILNAPRTVSSLVGLIVLVHIGLYFLPDNYLGLILIKLAYIPARFTHTEALFVDPIATVVSPIGYTLLHGGWMHLLVNCGMLLAFGSALARVVGDGYFYFVFCLGALAGAATMTAVDPQSVSPVIGASAAVSALLGAVAGLALKYKLTHSGFFINQRRTITFILFWLLINVVFGLVPGEYFGVNGRIAWEAHLGGFFVGLILPFIVPPAKNQPPED